MERRMGLRRAACAFAAVVTLACVVPTYAQTQSMERRSGAIKGKLLTDS